MYRAHIADPDIQDARAWWPFVCIGDNHEFSWQGWQSIIKYNGTPEPAQPLRVAANQAWWEFIPSRVAQGLRTGARSVRSAGGEGRADRAGRRGRPGRRAQQPRRARQHDRLPRDAIRRRTSSLILTDMHSFTMEDPTVAARRRRARLGRLPILLSAGGDGNPGRRPRDYARRAGRRDDHRVRRQGVPNFRKDEPPITDSRPRAEGVVQEDARPVHGDVEDLGSDSNGTLDMAEPTLRTCPRVWQRASSGRAAGYASFGGGDLSSGVIASAPNCTISSATSGSRGSSRSRATGTASGPATPPRTCLPGRSNPSGSLHLRFHLRPRSRRGARARTEGPSAAPAVRRRAAGRASMNPRSI